MNRYLLDTTALLLFFRNHPTAVAWLGEQAAAGEKMSICPVQLAEVYTLMKPHEEDRTRQLLGSFECLPLTSRIGELAGMIRNRFWQDNRRLSVPDVLTAAAALVHGCRVVTENTSHFPMPELQKISLLVPGSPD